MKRFILPMIPNVLLPYASLGFMLLFLTKSGEWQTGFFGVLAAYFLIMLLAALGALVFYAAGIAPQTNAKKLAFYVMLTKLFQIPAYVLLFVCGAISFITIFTAPLSVVFAFFSGMTIVFSGIMGIAPAKRLYDAGKINFNDLVFLIVLQFVYVVDVPVSVVIFLHAKKCAA